MTSPADSILPAPDLSAGASGAPDVEPPCDIDQLRLSEERYRLSAQASGDGLYDWNLRSGTVYYSPEWKAGMGFADDAIGGGPDEWLGRVHPEDLIWLRATLDAQATAGGKPFRIEYRITNGAGQERWMLCRGMAVLDENGQPARIVGSQADITDKQSARESLRRSEERYALAARGARCGLWDWDIPRDVFYCSAYWSEVLGFDEGERDYAISDWYAQFREEDRSRLRAAITWHLNNTEDYLEQEVRARHSGGADVWIQIRGVTVRDENGRPVRMAGSLSDITARKRAERQSLFEATHDRLTGLPNRLLLTDRLGQFLARHRRPGGRSGDGRIALMLIDIDRFKAINDSLGPLAGDEVLRTVAQRLEELRGPGDTIARMAHDQFGVLMDGVADSDAARQMGEKLTSAVTQPIVLADGQMVALSTGSGIVLSEPDYDDPADMLRDAALAMYQAKNHGSGRVELFDPSLRERAMTRLRLESDLWLAVEKQQFYLVYQPIVRLDDGRVAGFEALLRWRHPERGIIPPGDFIQLAEETGLILKIGRWALNEAARQLTQWQARFSPRLFMSVNVSGRQLIEDDLVRVVSQVLSDNPVTPGSLKLEITESILLEDPGHCQATMEALVALGVGLSLDDFGTGFSCLSYLHRYPVQTLKIDRSFVRTIGEQDQRAAIPRIIVLLAQALNMTVVAEGIERQEEADYLLDLKCDYGQGYHYARPLPADTAESLLETQAPRDRTPAPAGAMAGAAAGAP